MYAQYQQDIEKRKKLQSMVIKILEEKFKIFKQMIHDERIAQFESNEQMGNSKNEISAMK